MTTVAFDKDATTDAKGENGLISTLQNYGWKRENNPAVVGSSRMKSVDVLALQQPVLNALTGYRCCWQTRYALHYGADEVRFMMSSGDHEKIMNEPDAADLTIQKTTARRNFKVKCDLIGWFTVLKLPQPMYIAGVISVQNVNWSSNQATVIMSNQTSQ